MGLSPSGRSPDDMFFLDRIERISQDADQRHLATAGAFGCSGLGEVLVRRQTWSAVTR